MSTTHPYEPDFAIHPGETLLETLAAIGMSQKELAERTGRPLKTVNEIIQGKAAITADTALQLERVLGVAASFWNNAQRNYEAQLARIAETEALRRDVAWLKEFPLSQMSKMGWVPKLADPIEQLRAVLSFFGVAGVEEWRQLWQQPEVVFRKSRAFAAHPQSVAAWLRAGEREAQQSATQPFDKDKFSAALHEIRRHTTSEPETFEPLMKRLCAEAGVALVFVPEVAGSRAFGATRWLTSEKAIIQLSLRGKADDFLWFTFFHEAGHILLHGKKDIFLENLDYSDKDMQKEQEANEFACKWTLTEDEEAEILAAAPLSEEDIRQFAKQFNTHPAIIIGRLQHKKLIHYSLGREYFEPVIFE